MQERQRCFEVMPCDQVALRLYQEPGRQPLGPKARASRWPFRREGWQDVTLKRHAKNLNHVSLPEIKDFNALRDT